MPSWSRKIEARTFPADLCTRNFLGQGGVSGYAATPLIVALSPGHSDITRFRPWSPIATGNHLDREEINPYLLRRLAPLTFFIRVQAFREPLRGELPHVQIFLNDGPNPLTWDAQLLSYWFSRNPAVFQDQLVNLINNLWDCHCFGSSRSRRITGEKITTFKLGHPVSDMEYDDACYPNVSVRMAWISFGALPCRGKKTWWHLASRCCRNVACRLTCFLSASVTRKDLQFGTWTDPSFHRHYRVRPTTSGSRSG